MTWLFQFNRINGFPAIYNAENTSVTIDIAQVIIVCLSIIIGVSYLLIVPGYGRRKVIIVILHNNIMNMVIVF